MQKIELVKKPVRTISGVTPLTVVLKPRKCNHGTCIYCPGGEFVPQSYTDKSPAIMRALKLDFNPKEQVKNRLNVLEKMGHPTDKIELIILGGTFMQYPEEYRQGFIKDCFDALNGVDSRNLEEAKKTNELGLHRCVAMCIENRPDNCSSEEIRKMLSYGCTRVEIGVQMPDDEIYRKINRGHKVKDVVEATERLKNAGFKVGYHIMPGLPSSDSRKDLEMFRMIFSDERFRPDQLKIYPCQIVSDSPLAKIYKAMKFRPYSEEEAKKLISGMIAEIPNYCRVMRVLREFPKEKLVEGLENLGLRKDLEKELRNSGAKISEIRMREIGFNGKTDENLKLKTTEYGASNGREFFLEFVNDENILFGLLRLRIFEEDSNGDVNDKIQDLNLNNKIYLNKNAGVIADFKRRNLAEPISEQHKKQAIVRELHVYGQAVEIGEKGDFAQHRGMGKLLMEKAEEIAKENGIKKLAVISGIGVREYYRNLGYELDGVYMAKKLE